MPNWGLTSEQRETRPWGLEPELLAPGKTITDPVHGDVYLSRLEVLLVDSVPMQRLRRVRQLGTTHLAYPGAMHSRLSHAMGTLRAAQDLLDAVWNSRSNPQSRHVHGHLLDEWADQGTLNREFARATVLARLGALLHDLCHVPIGHTVEDDLQILTPHDANEDRFNRLWLAIDSAARLAIEGADGLFKELRPLIISKDEHAREFQSEYPFVADIVGNTICADLIDYLRRDHHNSGLPLSLGHRFMDSFFVVRSGHPHYAKKMVIAIDRDGRRRRDIVSELLKYLRYRYELTERVLTHHAKTAADAMLGKMLELWYDDECVRRAAQLASTDNLVPLDPNARKVTSPADPRVTPEIEEDVRAMLESEFLRRSDDGLLEHIVALGADPEASERMRGAAALAEGIQNRRLFKILGHAGGEKDLAMAKETFASFASDAKVRRQLEMDAARFAGVKPRWRVVVWLPQPAMRLKVAEVLVHQDGDYVTPLSSVEPSSREIVQAHQKLWAVTVYASAEVRDDPAQSDAILAYLGDRMALRFHRRDGSEVPSVRDLQVDAAARQLSGDPVLREQLLALSGGQAASGNEAPTFSESIDMLVAAARANGLAPSDRRDA